VEKILEWEVVYKIEPTLTQSEVFNGYHFEVKDNSTILKRTYTISVKLDARRIKSKTILLKTPDNEIINDKQEIRKFLLKRMLFTNDFSPISITYEPPILANKESLRAEGFETRVPVRSATTMLYSLLEVDNDSFSASDQFWQSGFNGATVSLEDSIYFIADWIEKSVAESNVINSFMLLWVAFNCLYETFTTVVCPMRARTPAIHRIDKTLYTLLSDGEISAVLRKQNGNIDRLLSYGLPVADRDILDGITIGRNTEKLLVTMGHVHKIRNYLFHQGSLHGEIEKQSEIAKTILMPVITALLRNIVQYN